SLDGVSPSVIVFHLRADEAFPKLSNDNLDRRLQWDRERLEKMEAYFAKRLDRVFKGKVDLDRPAPAVAIPPKNVRISAADLQKLWDDLAAADDRRLYPMIDRLA